MKNDIYTIDASVFIKIIIKEDDSHLALKLMHSTNKLKIINPTLFEYEIKKMCISSNVDLAFLETVLDTYTNSRLELKRPSLKDIDKAKEIMESCKDVGMPSFYDAIYHAIAINNNATFITADRKYYNKVKDKVHSNFSPPCTDISHILLLENLATTEG